MHDVLAHQYDRAARNRESARIEWLEEGRVRVCFDEPQRSVAPGQSCVIYRDRLVLAGGRICPSRS